LKAVNARSFGERVKTSAIQRCIDMKQIITQSEHDLFCQALVIACRTGFFPPPGTLRFPFIVSEGLNVFYWFCNILSCDCYAC